jgi:hypothetical protein
MKAMRRLGVLTVVGAMSIWAAGAARAAEVTRFSANGASASHNSFDPATSTAYDLAVTRNDQGSTSTTSFFFNKQICDASTCRGTFGFGTIPNGDFTSNPSTAKLNTNLAANPGYQVFNFVQDFANNTYTQTPTTGGVVVIDWKVIPRQSNSSTGVSTFVSGGFSTRFTGEQSSNRANTTGTLFGVTLPANSSSLLGTTKQSQIIISR